MNAGFGFSWSQFNGSNSTNSTDSISSIEGTSINKNMTNANMTNAGNDDLISGTIQQLSHPSASVTLECVGGILVALGMAGAVLLF